MKYYFMINPVSGKGTAKSLIPKIDEIMKKRGLDYEIIVSRAAHEAIDITRMLCGTNEEKTFFAVGGDGTLFDVINGAVGHDNVSVGIIPCGSGNDFVKSFGDEADFLDIESQLDGEAVPIDLIKFGDDTYSVNICSLGMDAEVVNHHNKHRVLSKINGSLSYSVSVFTAFIFNMNNEFHISADGEEIDGTYLFVIIANGRYYGGGFNPTPYARVNDGTLDLLLINAVSRTKVVQLMQKYRTGEHLNIPGLCVTRKVHNVEISMDKQMSVQTDGEFHRVEKAEFSVAPKAIKILLPKKIIDSRPDCIASKPGCIACK